MRSRSRLRLTSKPSRPSCGGRAACSPRTRRASSSTPQPRRTNWRRWCADAPRDSRSNRLSVGRSCAVGATSWRPACSCRAGAANCSSQRPSRSPTPDRSSSTCAAVQALSARRSPLRWPTSSCTPATSTRRRCAAPARTWRPSAATPTRAICTTRCRRGCAGASTCCSPTRPTYRATRSRCYPPRRASTRRASRSTAAPMASTCTGASPPARPTGWPAAARC